MPMRFLSNLLASTLGVLLAVAIVVLFGVLFLFAVVASTETTPVVRPGSVLVVNLNGEIPDVVSPDPISRRFAGQAPFDVAGVVTSIRMAARDDRIAGMWIQVRRIDASWAALEEIRNALTAFKGTKKPIYASSDDYATDETAYFLTSSADSIYASEQALFTFNGFSLTSEFYQKLLDQLDVRAEVVRAGKYKSAVEPYTRTSFSTENEEQLTSMLAVQNDLFMQAVAESRGKEAAALGRLAAHDPVLTPRAAVEAGLIDGLLYHDQVRDVIERRLGVDDDHLRTIDLEDYQRVPPSDAGLDVNDGGDVAVVYAVGTIVSGSSDTGSLLSEATVGAETFNQAMRTAREDDGVRAVVLRIDSPGGSAAAADAMWREIKRTAEQKPVVVSMGGVAASGGYWITTAADAVVADPLTITGSIGVFGLFFDLSGLFENKLGVTFDQVQTSPYADIFSNLHPLSPPERALLQRQTDDTYQRFLANVAESRGMDTSDVDAIAQGRVWMGTQAKELGLVDTLGDLHVAIDMAADRAGLGPGPYHIRVLPRPRSLVEQIAEGLGTRAVQAYARIASTPEEGRMLRQARTVRALARDHGTVQARMPLVVSIH